MSKNFYCTGFVTSKKINMFWTKFNYDELEKLIHRDMSTGTFHKLTQSLGKQCKIIMIIQCEFKSFLKSTFLFIEKAFDICIIHVAFTIILHHWKLCYKINTKLSNFFWKKCFQNSYKNTVWVQNAYKHPEPDFFADLKGNNDNEKS